VARALLDEGASVVLVGRDARRGAEAEELLGEPGRTRFVAADVRRPDAIEAAVQEAARGPGRLGVLVASAGVGVVQPLLETGPDDWRWIWETNVSGVLFSAQAGMRAMRTTGGGSVILIGSDAGMVAERSIGAYSVTKTAVVAMTKVLALDGAEDGIRVNCVCPGYFEPGMRHFPDRGAPAEADGASGYTDPPKPPTGRYADVTEIARAVLYFALPASSFSTGSVLLVDGGATAGIP
jgi:NAD(P)-dependent dehydrogenase (short-subunit alcohol dehydrogenase family)